MGAIGKNGSYGLSKAGPHLHSQPRMKPTFTAALAIGALAMAGCATRGGGETGALIVPNPHGGYNVIQQGDTRGSIPFFGAHGYATKVIAESHTEKPNFILVPEVEDVGHGNKITVYKKLYFAPPQATQDVQAPQSSQAPGVKQ